MPNKASNQLVEGRKVTKGAPIRWTIEVASGEFGIDYKTLTKRLKQLDIPRADDGRYSTRQICAAVFGDLQGERLRNEKLKADLLEIELAREQGRVIEGDFLQEYLSDVFIAMTQRIKSWQVDDAKKGDMLQDLRELEYERIADKCEEKLRKG